VNFTKSWRILFNFQLHELFSCQMDVWMREKGFCCGRWYWQQPRSINCNGKKGCVVPVNTVYFRLNDFTYCTACFDKFQGDHVILDDM
jgi:hypothetical protein